MTFTCSAWVWEPSEAFLTVGCLPAGTEAPSIEDGCHLASRWRHNPRRSRRKQCRAGPARAAA